MTERELLVDCLRRLNRADVTYYLTGSMASNYWGIPRTTHDLDFVVQLPPAAVPRIVEEFSGDFYLEEAAVRAALRRACVDRHCRGCDPAQARLESNHAIRPAARRCGGNRRGASGGVGPASSAALGARTRARRRAGSPVEWRDSPEANVNTAPGAVQTFRIHREWTMLATRRPEQCLQRHCSRVACRLRG